MADLIPAASNSAPALAVDAGAPAAAPVAQPSNSHLTIGSPSDNGSGAQNGQSVPYNRFQEVVQAKNDAAAKLQAAEQAAQARVAEAEARFEQRLAAERAAWEAKYAPNAEMLTRLRDAFSPAPPKEEVFVDPAMKEIEALKAQLNEFTTAQSQREYQATMVQAQQAAYRAIPAEVPKAHADLAVRMVRTGIETAIAAGKIQPNQLTAEIVQEATRRVVQESIMPGLNEYYAAKSAPKTSIESLLPTASSAGTPIQVPKGLNIDQVLKNLQTKGSIL